MTFFFNLLKKSRKETSLNHINRHVAFKVTLREKLVLVVLPGDKATLGLPEGNKNDFFINHKIRMLL